MGWIDFGEIPGELPGNPNDYLPPGIGGDIIITPPVVPPGPGEPGYVPPGPGEPGYVPPGPGEPGYVPPGPGEPGYVPPGPGEPGYVPPGPGELGYVPPGPGEPGYVPPGPGPDEPGYVPPYPGEPGYVPPGPGEPGYVPPGPGQPGYVPPPFGLPGAPPPGAPPPGAPTPGAPTPGAPAPGAPAPGAPAPGAPAGPVAGGGYGYSGGYGSPGSGVFDFGPGAFGPGGWGAATGGFNFGGIDCCLDKDNWDLYVHIGYATLTMNCGDIQGFTIEGRHTLCDSTNYSWSLSQGSGSLDVTDSLAPVYTAPAGGPTCESPAIINLHCGGVIIDTIIIVLNPCPSTLSIGYTTQQMSVNEQQTLTAVPGTAGCGIPVYDWAITSGGGTLSLAQGTSTIYTAPATNANCTLNPTITLSCDGVVFDTLTIAVNGHATVYVACQRGENPTTICQYPPDANCPEPLCNWEKCGFDKVGYTCGGVLFSSTTYLYQHAVCVTVGTCKDIATQPDCLNISHTYAWWTANVVDCRTPANKTAGCCPALLL